MASEYCTRLCKRPVTFIRHKRPSVLTSYSSPTCTCLAAFTAVPSCLTFPLSHAVAASDRVLNKRIDHRYLSIRSLSDFSLLLIVYSSYLISSKLNKKGEWKTHPPLTIYHLLFTFR